MFIYFYGLTLKGSFLIFVKSYIKVIFIWEVFSPDPDLLHSRDLDFIFLIISALKIPVTSLSENYWKICFTKRFLTPVFSCGLTVHFCL